MSAAFAGEAKVNWQDPDKYMDVRPVNETKANFRNRVFKELDSAFADLAKKLPDGYSLNVNVTDLDLAGEVWPTRNGRDMRIVRDIDWPAISFSYVLKNAEGQDVKSGREDLKDMNFQTRPNVRSSSEDFYYEKALLGDWFSKQQRSKAFPTRE
jgi:hypothetical protein